MCVPTMSPNAAVAWLLGSTKRIILKGVQSSTYYIAHLLLESDASWNGPERSKESLPARLLDWLCVTFSTAYRRTLVSEHCTHRIHVPVGCTPAARAIPRVVSSLGCPRK